MSYTDLRDFTPEYSVRLLGSGLRVQIEKLGGGTVGRAYEGTWRYVATNVDTGAVVAQGQDIHTGTPKTHAEAAEIVRDFITEGE